MRAAAERLNLRLLEVFRAVMDANGVTEAAAKLNISQPAVSKAVAQLEQSLDLHLFGRSHGRLHPSSDAHRLYAETERLFAQVGTFRDRLSRLSRAREGELIVAAIPTLATSIVAYAAARFGVARPEVKVQIVTAGAADVTNAVGQHRCDIGLVHSPVTDKTVASDVIGESEIVAILASDHKLTKHKTLTPALLARERLILNDTGSPSTHLVYETFSAAQVGVRIAMEANSSAVANAAVRAGSGIALIDPWPNHPVPMPGVAMRRFRPRVPLRVTLLHSVFRPPSRLAGAFRTDLESALREAAGLSPFIRAR